MLTQCSKIKKNISLEKEDLFCIHRYKSLSNYDFQSAETGCIENSNSHFQVQETTWSSKEVKKKQECHLVIIFEILNL